MEKTCTRPLSSREQEASTSPNPLPCCIALLALTLIILGHKVVYSLLKALGTLQAAVWLGSHGVLAWQAGDEAQEVALDPTMETESSCPCEE